ncbi:hypothetical protein NQ315_015872 [Exocentrus adspersus]|uniref:Reticulocalbin-3 n=1 Tax=Exocentrus adspersus TaxID=1586481 RepID=A0AAV8W373_9CUCU|nr:hypothetical protein NQ315_015872 [Exocentrus adspersus]
MEVKDWLIYILFLPLYGALAGIVHSHSSELNKERESDGSYKPRDHHHFSDEESDHRTDFDHEAILGSHREAEEYDHLPPEEAKKRLGILAGKMDLNGDQAVDRNELKAWIMRSFKMLSEEEARDRMEDADEDGDGFVTWNEYLTDTYGAGEDSEEALTFEDDNLHFVEDDKEMWKAADRNGDGQLDSREWLSFSHPEEDPNLLPVILKQTLKEKDLDGDGFISFQEYMSDRGKDMGKSLLLSEKQTFDDSFDHDRDGKLNSEEILNWIVPSNEKIAEEEVQHLFQHCDDDIDQRLSFEEILNHHDIFVGSEATDYGDHLHNIHHFTDEL